VRADGKQGQGPSLGGEGRRRETQSAEGERPRGTAEALGVPWGNTGEGVLFRQARTRRLGFVLVTPHALREPLVRNRSVCSQGRRFSTCTAQLFDMLSFNKENQ